MAHFSKTSSGCLLEKALHANHHSKCATLSRVYRSWRFLKLVSAKLILLVIFTASIYLLLKRNDFFDAKGEEFRIDFKNIRMDYWMDAPDPGCPGATKLLILIMTRRGAFNNRQNIRQTWLKDAVRGTVTKFLIADPPWNITEANEANVAVEQAMLGEEQKLLHDLIFIRGIEDSYANLHLKWLAALHWHRAFCPQAEWIMKTDDDTIVHLPRLDHWIERKLRKEVEGRWRIGKDRGTYFGWIISGVGPIRDAKHKWFVPKSAYPGNSYPPYMQGATYVATNKAISSILEHTEEVAGFNMDDVLFTGILAQKAGVTLSDHKEMFRVGNQLKQAESCEDGVPYATALYGSSSLEDYTRIYDNLKGVNCTNSS